MAENTIKLEGVTTTNGNVPVSMPNNNINSPMFTTPGNPPGYLFYTYSLIEAAGVVASNNFLSIFNPVGSGKTVNLDRIVVMPWASAGTTATRSMTVQRITAASAGTLVSAANIPKFITSQANSIAEIRTANPTVTTTGVPTLGFPPALVAGANGTTGMATIIPPTGSIFRLSAGEGLVFNTAAGDVDQLWNINLAWSEQ